jgi:hypothetical protein
MLRDGQFIKEEPPKIGAHYSVNIHQRKATPEECFVQDVLLGINPYTTNKFEKILGKLLSI